MSQTPLLSIVAAVYNGEKFLAQFFECLEQQQLESYELIPVNDGSTDNSLAVIAEWRDRLAERPGTGAGKPGASRSRAIPASPPPAANIWRFRISTTNSIRACIARCWRWPRKNISISRPATAPTCMKSAARATRSSRWIALPSTGVLPGHVWLKQALDSRKFLHVTWLNIYRHDFIRQHHFHFRARPAPSGYPVDDRGAAGRGARAVHQPAVL